jgi:hypothetical protein
MDILRAVGAKVVVLLMLNLLIQDHTTQFQRLVMKLQILGM